MYNYIEYCHHGIITATEIQYFSTAEREPKIASAYLLVRPSGGLRVLTG